MRKSIFSTLKVIVNYVFVLLVLVSLLLLFSSQKWEKPEHSLRGDGEEEEAGTRLYEKEEECMYLSTVLDRNVKILGQRSMLQKRWKNTRVTLYYNSKISKGYIH